MGRVAVVAIVILWTLPVSILVNRIVPDPYMDEIFHMPQAQQYCKGNFRSWDAMITTPPGLYYVSLLYVASFFPGMYISQTASVFSDICSVVVLRSINVLLAVICSVLVFEIVTHLKPALDERKSTICAVVLSLYPLHWFFNFLYYTDVSSLTAVMATYLMSLKRNYWFSALLGSLAVLIRQTNIVWVLFIGCVQIIEICLAHSRDGVEVHKFNSSTRMEKQSYFNITVMKVPHLRKRKLINTKDSVHHLVSCTSNSSATCLLDEVQVVLLTAWKLKWELLPSFSPFLLVLVASAGFVCWNGSIVLGAKEAHAVSLHFAQILYFGMVSALALAPLHFSFSRDSLFRLFWKNWPWSSFPVSMAIATGFLLVRFFSIAHPYLLSDNRHYPFYLWRKVIRVHWSMKYLLVPFYVYSWFFIIHLLGKFQKKTWVLVYFLACVAVLVPAPLIEFRYYTVPFYLLVLHSRIDSAGCWILIGLLYAVVNVFTMALFLFRPFRWDHELGIQRFIW